MEAMSDVVDAFLKKIHYSEVTYIDYENFYSTLYEHVITFTLMSLSHSTIKKYITQKVKENPIYRLSPKVIISLVEHQMIDGREFLIPIFYELQDNEVFRTIINRLNMSENELVEYYDNPEILKDFLRCGKFELRRFDKNNIPLEGFLPVNILIGKNSCKNPYKNALLMKLYNEIELERKTVVGAVANILHPEIIKYILSGYVIIL